MFYVRRRCHAFVNGSNNIPKLGVTQFVDELSGGGESR